MIVSPTYITPLRLPPATVDIGLRLDVGMARLLRRARCHICRQRRVLYRIEVHTRIPGMTGGGTEARCAHCWGVRP